MATHNHHGAALETLQGQREAQEAEAIRSLVRCRAAAIGDETSSTRLGQDGPAGYPGLDDVGLIADVLGGSLVIQIGDVQILKGDGPLIGHLHATVCMDASGHESMHWEILQSWYVHVDDDPVHDEEQHDTLPAADLENFPQADLDPLLQKRLTIPGAEGSRDQFDAMFARLLERMNEDEAMIPDSPREEFTLVGHAKQVLASIVAAHPSWPPEMQHLALVALHVYKCRLTDVYMREYVMLTHVILGMGRELLRAHDRTAYTWNNLHGVWHRFEGLLPEDIYTYLKLTLLALEGLFRTFTGEVERTDADVLEAISQSFIRHGRDWKHASTAYRNAASCNLGSRYDASRRRPGAGTRTPQHRSGDRTPHFRPPPEDGEDTVAEDTGHADSFALPDPSEPWYVFLAKGIARIGRSLEQHLLGTKLLSYYSEWCSTPRPVVSGIAYLGVAFLYDDPSRTPM
ncbi:MAG: hypothetical protein GY772_15440, partial [bacterium]|nr:hypothetical protein [bacterium]